MLINDQSLRNFIRVILAEGIEEDFRTLLSNNPESAGALLSIEGITDPGTKRKIKSWLVANFMGGDLVSTQETIGTLKEYADNVKSIVSSYVNPTNVDFKASVDRILSAKTWTNPGDIPSMTLEDFRVILEEYKKFKESKKQRVKIDRQSSAWMRDKIGETANWNVWFPSSRDNSISIYENNGGKAAHEVCMQAGLNTTGEAWCTSRSDRENLFNSYAAKGVMLYYVTRKISAVHPHDLLSIEISSDNRRKTPEIVEGEDASPTVDVAQRGLKVKEIQQILGSEFKIIREIMVSHFVRTGGEHPVSKELLQAAKDYDRWAEFTEGNSLDTRVDLIKSAESKFHSMNNKNVKNRVKERHNVSLEIQDEVGRELLSSLPRRAKASSVKSVDFEIYLSDAARFIAPGKAKRLAADVLQKIAPRFFIGDSKKPGVFQMAPEREFFEELYDSGELEEAGPGIKYEFMRFLELEISDLRQYITILVGGNRGWWDAPGAGIKSQILEMESVRERAGNGLLARLRARADKRSREA